MKFLGIDYGSKRVGVALSDESETFALPKVVLNNEVSLLGKIAEICEEENVGGIVFGDSRDFSGKENPVMFEAKVFAEEIGKKTGLEIFFEPEFLTSVEAERIQGKNSMHDASSAALILKSFLDKRKKHDDLV